LRESYSFFNLDLRTWEVVTRRKWLSNFDHRLMALGSLLAVVLTTSDALPPRALRVAQYRDFENLIGIDGLNMSPPSGSVVTVSE
jgi:hypothetical protein